MKLTATEVGKTVKLGAGASGVSASLSLALIGVGHLVGLSVGLAMLVGMLIAWGGLMPVLTAAQGAVGSVDAVVGAVLSQQVRFIGAGTIGVATLWTLLKRSAGRRRGKEWVSQCRSRGSPVHSKQTSVSTTDRQHNTMSTTTKV